MSVKYTIKNFDELSAVDVYYILQARSQVFVVEQNCVYQDIDELDFNCLHLVAHRNKELVGYCRIVPPDEAGMTESLNPRIGRVLVLPANRHEGIARQIMNRAIKHCQSKYGKRPIQIAAQTYLIAFYQSLGFEVISNPYVEDGLEHIDMVLKQTKNKYPLPTVSKFSTSGILINIVLFLIAITILGLLYLLI